jgi:hypothetical protein
MIIDFIFAIIKSYSQSWLCSNSNIFLIYVILPKLISKCVRIEKNKNIEIRIATIPVEFLMSKIVSLLENEAILSGEARDELEEIKQGLVSMKYFFEGCCYEETSHRNERKLEWPM